MTKKIVTVIIGLFLLGALAMLVAVNSFFRENARLLNEQKKLTSTTQKLQQEVSLLKKKIPPEPHGAVVDKIAIAPVSSTETSQTPMHTVDFWVDNPTANPTPVMQGIIAAQQINASGTPRWNYWAIQIASIPPGERRNVVTNPLVLGAPGQAVEITVSLWEQPGIAKTRYQVPSISTQAEGDKGAETTQTPKGATLGAPPANPKPAPKPAPTPPLAPALPESDAPAQ